MHLTHPEFLWLLTAVPLLLLIEVGAFRRGRRDLSLFVGGRRNPALQNVYLVKWFFSMGAFVLFYALTVVALVGVHWGERPVEEDRTGLDIAFLVDVSRSMYAADLDEPRLRRARRIVRGVVEEMAGSRFSIVVFRGQAVTAMPMTEDSIAVQSFLDAVGPGLLSSPGSDIEEGVDTALDSFPDALARNRIVVLLSDGEALSGQAAPAAGRAADNGIPLVPVMTGTREGSTIELPSGQNVTDEQGQVVVSRADPTLLQELAERSGGRFFDGSDPSLLSDLVSYISTYVERQERQGFRLVDVPRYRTFLMLGLLFLAISITIRVIPWRGVL
jgi:Ca-activated chloride channel family protein